MLTAEQIQNLKRTNVSKSAEKTRQRAEELLRPAKIAQKKVIRELAGVSTQVLHSIYSTGNISIKMVIAVSQTLNISPFYLTGAADEPGECSDATLRDLLLKYGYRSLVASLELAEKKKRADAAAPQPAGGEASEEQLVDAANFIPLPAEPQWQLDINALDETDLRFLLSGIAIQAKAGIPSAKERLEKIMRLLLA